MIINYNNKEIEIPDNFANEYLSQQAKESIIIKYELYQAITSRPENQSIAGTIREFSTTCSIPNLNIEFRSLQNIWLSIKD